MSKEDIKVSLDKARVAYKKKNIVSWIGKTQTGKTVASTLLYDTLHTSFLQKNKDNYTARVLKGQDEFEIAHKRMLKGYFPIATHPESKSELIIEIANKKPLGKKIEIMLRDASGEDLQKILQKQYDTKEELIQIILDKHKKDAEFGPLSYVIFSKIFVLLIDCSIFEEWRSEQIRISQIVNSILDMKRAIGEVKDGKFDAPVAVVFTKFDRLPDSILIQNKKKLTSEEILAKYLPAVDSALQACHNGPLKFYQFSISGITKVTEEEAKKIAHEEATELNARNASTRAKAREDAEKQRQETIESRVKKESDEARQNALNRGNNAQQAEEAARVAGEEERQSAEEEIQIDEAYIDAVVKRTSELAAQNDYFKIKLPIKYSEREYTKFILWLIERLPR